MIKKPLRNVLLVVALLLLVLAAWFGYAFYIQLKRAKMASQCAILSKDIFVYMVNADEEGRPANLDEFLSHYGDGTLFRRDHSGRLIDSWGHPLAIEPAEHDDLFTIKVNSAGRDGRLGTADDFSREFTFKRHHPSQP